MKTRIHMFTLRSVVVFSLVLSGWAQDTVNQTPAGIFRACVDQIVQIIQPAPEAAPLHFSARIELTQGKGVPKSLMGQSVKVRYQAPDRLGLVLEIDNKPFAAARNGQQIWIYAPEKQFGVIGKPGVARFGTAPHKVDATQLPAFKLPIAIEQITLLPLLMNIEQELPATVGKTECHVLRVTPKREAIEALKFPKGQLTLSIRKSDFLPVRIGYREGNQLEVEVQLEQVQVSKAKPDAAWTIPKRESDRIETTALSHLIRFGSVALALLEQDIPTLGPATGDRRVIGVEGKGRLELIDGTRVLFLKGTPEEMGTQHGKLLRREIRNVTDQILYGVGVGSSFEKGRWFFGEIEEAQSRIAPYIDPRYLREMDAIAKASGCEPEETRLANFFPELFHCSGFALFGEATAGNRMYHGRILDYLRGVGLEQNAVVMVMQPDQGNAWVNISYAGFVGSVTAMNEKHVAIGEMGGRGEGNWDGKPMAQLVREVMEKANTIDEAIEIMRRGPRTCEYYYVISDANSNRAVGIAAAPDRFEIVRAGESHPQLLHPIDDAVLMSAGDRYENLVKRVKALYGQFDASTARDLMKRPVAMKSNIHSVLFAPDTLDFWVANADSKNVASHTRYTHYNLAELLKSSVPEGAKANNGE